MEQIFLAYGRPKETITAIMMFYRKTKINVRSPDEDLDFFDIIIFTNPSAREGYDTRSIFKRSLTGLNSKFSFS